MTAARAGASGHVCPPSQVLSELLDSLATLMAAEITPVTQAQHNVEVAELRGEIAQAREELNAENVRMAMEQAALEAEAQRIQAEAFRLNLDQNASNVVLRRRHQSCLPLILRQGIFLIHLGKDRVTCPV